MDNFEVVFQTVLKNYNVYKNKDTGKWEKITRHIPQYKQAKKRQCETNSEVWNYWTLLYESYIMRQQGNNAIELERRIEELEKNEKLDEEEIERLCQCVSDLTRENKSLRKKSQEETIAELRQEIYQLKEELDKWVYGN